MPAASRKLARYRAKRDFKKTAEPTGSEKAHTGHSYLIQKHAARRLHYDFRLEMDGVLKSWAVTKGPSLNPADKRLAVHVEDHPLAYGTFEGTIPAGEYGGGTVMLWDEGSWQPVGDAERSYKKGHLSFDLQGKRLKGRWHLVRMGHAQKGGKENWLLIKSKDKYAKEDGDYAIEHFDKSVATGRSMEKIAGSSKVWTSKAKAKPTQALPKKVLAHAKRLKGAAPPDFVAPQLATLVSTPPEGKNWVHEIKFDGYRLLARLSGGKVRLITRANNDWTPKFKSTAEALAELDVDNALIDGEIVHQTSDGTMSFHALQNALSEGNHRDLHYYAFDILFLNGEDLRAKPLLERKAILEKLLRKPPPHIHYSQHFTDPGDKVLEHACHIALEGIVSKRADRPYHSGRDEDWMKSKCIKEQEIVIGGFTEQSKHAGLLAALLTGYYEKGKFIYAGKVGTGFSQSEGRNILKQLQKLQTKNAPFDAVPSDIRRGAFWVEPRMVAQVHFTEWTEDGRMRHPSFQGIREDKPARDVIREKAKKPPMNSKSSEKAMPEQRAKPNGKMVIAGIPLSHPEKELYPASHITKKELAEYYERIAPLMLPHIIGRPLSLLRCPQGEGHTCFFQRHAPDMPEKYVKPVPIKGKGKDEPYLMIKDIHGLIALVQMDVLEIHSWGAEAKTPQKPDRLVFDFDPAPDVKFSEVKKAARDLRERLRSIRLTSFLKTTGGKGLHVAVPFRKGPSWDEVKTFTRALAMSMEKDDPGRFTTNSRKDKRRGKIFIDYLRNGFGASAVAPYSCRAKPEAPIALPLAWDELDGLKTAHDFTLRHLRLAKKDPWREMFKTDQTLPIKEMRKALP